jgi:pilus assembly protein CpaF
MATPATRFDLFLCYLEPIRSWVEDPSVTEILINPSGNIFVERCGVMQQIDAKIDRRDLEFAATQVARRIVNVELDEANPAISTKLDDGSRISIIVPPASPEGIAFAIRKFPQQRYELHELIESGSIPFCVVEELGPKIEAGHTNVLVSGACGSGKTTALNALASALIPLSHRIVVAETEAREIQLQCHPNVLYLQAGPHASMSKMLFELLRQRPKRIIVGEVRGGEAFDLLKALNSGHSGSFATLHADSPQQALDQLTSYVLEADSGLSYQAIRLRIANSIQYVLQLVQLEDGRRITDSLVRVDRYGASEDSFLLTDLYRSS